MATWRPFFRPAVSCLAVLTLLLACGGGGGSGGSPTAPPAGGTAAISGQVISTGAGSMGSRAPISGVTILVEGTSLSSVTDSEGRFALAGVPAGDQMLTFDRGGQRASLMIGGVKSAERIILVVVLTGSTAEMQSIERGTNAGLPSITVEKSTNGEDADDPPGPSIPVGDAVSWEYVVTNNGEETLSDVAVSDDQGVTVSCPMTTLPPMGSMTCTGNGVSVEGQYANLGTVTAVDPAGSPATDDDPSHYLGVVGGEASLTVEKSTNGEDADDPPGPSIPVGDAVNWEYFVTNDGGVDLFNLAVSDDQGVEVTCLDSELPVGASTTCTGTGVAIEGQYANVGTAIAEDSTGNPATDDDPSHYLGVVVAEASIAIEKSTNGEDADAPPGPSIPVGDPVSWEYFVTNDGGVDLVNLFVSDDQGVEVTCPVAELAVGESTTCTAAGVAIEGQYANVGTAAAEDGEGNAVTNKDPSHYFGEVIGPGDFTTEIQPDHWNTNWPGSSGTVSAKIQDGDLAAIDPASIILFENDPTNAAVPVNVPTITGNHIRARFSKPDAFGVLDTPQTGETRTVVVSFLADGVPVELPVEIEIVGPPI